MMFPFSFARKPFGTAGFGTIRAVTVNVVFQRCPGAPAALGISGLDYELTLGGKTKKSATGADGKVTVVLLPGEEARLVIMGTEYRLSLRDGYEDISKLKGIQRRLQTLGYYVGIVDGKIGEKTEYAVLNFQADHDPLRVDGIPGPHTQSKIKNVVGE